MRLGMQDQLVAVIMRVLVTHPELHYYQVCYTPHACACHSPGVTLLPGALHSPCVCLSLTRSYTTTRCVTLPMRVLVTHPELHYYQVRYTHHACACHSPRVTLYYQVCYTHHACACHSPGVTLLPGVLHSPCVCLSLTQSYAVLPDCVLHI